MPRRRRARRGRLRWSILACAGALALLPAGGASGQDGEWPGLQGGAAHLGVASSPVPVPLRVKWRVRPPGTGDGAMSSAVVGPDVAVANGRATVVAFDPESGAIRWTRARARGAPLPPALASSAGEHGVVVTTEGSRASDAAVMGLDLATGSVRWRVKLKQAVVAAPTADGAVAYVGGQDRFVYAIDAASGRIRWRARARSPVQAAPAAADGRVYVVSEDASSGAMDLEALNALNGKRLWSFSPRGVGAGTSTATVGKGRVYVGFGDQTVRALDAATGAERWAEPVRAPFSPSTAPALSGRDLFVADDRGALYRFDARSGHRVWDFQFDASQFAGAPLVDGPFVLLALDDGDLEAVEISSGDLVWRARLGVGPAGALATLTGALLIPLLDRAGGIVALEHDPGGHLIRIETPTRLHLPIALANFAGAFAVLLAALWAAFRFVPGLRSARRLDEGQEPTREGSGAGADRSGADPSREAGASGPEERG